MSHNMTIARRDTAIKTNSKICYHILQSGYSIDHNQWTQLILEYSYFNSYC